jgi:type I restriction enzyme S subunit
MPESVDKGVPYVMTGDLTEFASDIDFERCKQVSRNDYLKLSERIKSSKGDIIMARYATIGTGSYIDVDREFLVSYSCVTIKPKPSKALGLYLFHFFKSLAFIQGIQQQVNANTQDNIGIGGLKKIKIMLPNLTEQAEIIEYLAVETAKLDTLTAEAQRAIDLLKERRSALISAAVTGKIDVRGFHAQP